MASEPAGYGVSLDVVRSDSQSRITNFPLFIGTFIRVILLIPHLVVMYFLGIVAAVLYFIATFAILFTGRYPEGMYRFIAGVLTWNANVGTYLFHLHDAYPPFAFTADADYPVRIAIAQPDRSSRILNFPLFIGMTIRVILLIPHLIVMYFLQLVLWVVLFIAQFAILFGGSFPAGMHRFATGVMRWAFRINAYVYGLTDRYPPFSMDHPQTVGTPPPPETTLESFEPITDSGPATAG